MPTVNWYASKVVVVASAFLLGSFFVHWLADHSLIWQGTEMPSHAVETSLRASGFPPGAVVEASSSPLAQFRLTPFL